MEKIANDDCTLKQMKDNQVKVNTPEIYRELTLVLKDKMQTSTLTN